MVLWLGFSLVMFWYNNTGVVCFFGSFVGHSWALLPKNRWVLFCFFLFLPKKKELKLGPLG